MTKELSQKQFALLLSLTPHLGQKGIERILRQDTVAGRTGNEFLMLPAEQKAREYNLRPAAASALTEGLSAQLEELEKLEHRIRARGVELLTLQSAGYPARLEEFMPEPPALVFAYGNLSLLDQPTFCALSSREISAAGKANVEAVVERLIFERKTLVSGHNTEGYQRASVTALRWGSPRIIALDCGLFQGLGDNLTDEPFKIARLYRYQFDPSTDLVVSPFRLSDPFIGANNKLRDELVVALSDELVAVEVREGGTMEGLGLRALAASRTVMAVEYPEYNVQNRGNQGLIQAGALAF